MCILKPFDTKLFYIYSLEKKREKITFFANLTLKEYPLSLHFCSFFPGNILFYVVQFATVNMAVEDQCKCYLQAAELNQLIWNLHSARPPISNRNNSGLTTMTGWSSFVFLNRSCPWVLLVDTLLWYRVEYFVENRKLFPYVLCGNNE